MFVEEELLDYKFWLKISNSDLLITPEQLNTINDSFVLTEDCGMNDILNDEWRRKILNEWSFINKEHATKYLIDKVVRFSQSDMYDKTIMINRIIDDSLSILKEQLSKGYFPQFGIVKKNYIPLQNIPTQIGIPVDSKMEYFRVTDLMSGDYIYSVLQSESGGNHYVFSQFGEGWITLESSDDIEFLDYTEWIKKVLISKESRKIVTNEKILIELFSQIGKSYHWGSVYDCAGFVRLIFSRLGIIIPSNTTKQKKLPCLHYGLSSYNKDDKSDLISKLPIGTVLYMPHHASILIGTYNNRHYVINSLDDFYDPVTFQYRQSKKVQLNSLNYLRASGKSWLESIDHCTIPWILK